MKVESTEQLVTVRKTDEELQILWAEVYVPDQVDSQGDFMRAESIRDMAYDFAKKGLFDAIDLEHDNNKTGSRIVEFFIARKGDETFIEGSWVVGIWVPDKDLWSKVKGGDINGLSMEVRSIHNPVEVVAEIPPLINGKTHKADGDDHEHTFTVYYNEQGQFLGGSTDVAVDAKGNAHSHRILRGTATEKANDHSHRFAVHDYLKGVAA